MTFNPDLSKQLEEIKISRKTVKDKSPFYIFQYCTSNPQKFQ